MSAPKCIGCGHAKRNHVNGVGRCLAPSCKLCLMYRSALAPVARTSAAPEGWSPDQIEQFQAYWDSFMMGDAGLNDRIRWSVPTAGIIDGNIGTLDAAPYAIWKPHPVCGEWALTSNLPGQEGKRAYGDDPETLKPRAEEWLIEFVSSLGAIFPDAPVARSFSPEEARDA